jgi:hypothetical protein
MPPAAREARGRASKAIVRDKTFTEV